MNISGNMASYSYMPSATKSGSEQNLPDASDLFADALLDPTKKKDRDSLVQTADEAKAAAKAKNDKAIEDFNSYMSKSTMEKYTDAWLEQHGISKEEYEKMPPEKKAAIAKQMQEDIEREMKQTMEKNRQPTLNILA